MRIAHLADVHLDRAFAGSTPAERARARQRLRDGFVRCLEVARDRGCDLITIGGDLWEEENVRIDTRRFVANQLDATGVPVVMICGNHDPFLPGGNYERTDWPPNVHLIRGTEPNRVSFGDVSIWGMSWTGTQPSASSLESIDTSTEGTNVLLIHGTAQAVGYFANASAHCPFNPNVIRELGFDLCLAGHIHRASFKDGVVYPGSPEPLSWGETGRHTVAIIEAGPTSQADLVDVNRHRYLSTKVDCEGCSSSDEILARAEGVVASLADKNLHLTIELGGEIDPACEVPLEPLANAWGGSFAEVRASDTTLPAYDLDRLAQQETIKGIFIRGMRERMENAGDDAMQAQLIQQATVAGLRALDGRKDVVDVV